MDIINEVFATIKTEIIHTIQSSDNPYLAARHIAINFSLDPSTARLLLQGIEEVFETYQ